MSERPMMPVLVVGGAGYIGSHACKALAGAGFRPVALDNLSRGHRRLVRWGPLEEGDAGDRALLDRVLARWKPVAVMHFAALSEVGESVRQPHAFYRNNVAATLTLLEAMREHGVDRLVFSSTCATYGLPDRVPMAEDTPQRPINPYGRSKLAVEWLLADSAAAYGLNWVALRYFNACGADPDGETGELHEPETHLIPRTLMAADGQAPQLSLFGTDYPTPDGTCIRDYIHVTDLAAAHVRALRYSLGGGESRAFNLGTGRGQSVRAIIRAVERITGLTVPVREEPRRPGDPPALVADPRLAEQVLRFQAPLSDLDSIVRTAWAWHRKTRRPAEAPAA